MIQKRSSPDFRKEFFTNQLIQITEGMVIAMQKYECGPCGYVYDPAEGDPDNGIAPGTVFEDLPDDWVCPICGAGKEDFSPVD